MRWKLYVCPHCGSDWGPSQRHHPMNCDACNRSIPGRELREVEVIPASFTDEDVERVAGGMALSEDCDSFSQDAEFPGEAEQRALNRGHYRKLARAALSAYLEPTTKGDT